jgi:hypothetical protein
MASSQLLTHHCKRFDCCIIFQGHEITLGANKLDIRNISISDSLGLKLNSSYSLGFSDKDRSIDISADSLIAQNESEQGRRRGTILLLGDSSFVLILCLYFFLQSGSSGLTRRR